MAKKSFRKAVLLKMETTYGVDPVPTGATNSILIRSAQITPIDLQTEDRTLVRAYFGAYEKIIVGQLVKLDYEVEMVASGTLGVPPQWGPSLRICGFAEIVTAGVSVVYTPISSGWESGAFYYNVDGILHKILGARGSVKFSLKAGGIPVVQFSVLGLYSGPTDTGLPSQTFTALKPVAANNANTNNFQLHSYGGVLAGLSLDCATKPTYKNLVGAERVDIEDHSVSGQLAIELPTIAVKNFFSISKDGTTGLLAVTHGTVAGSKVQLNCPNTQILNLAEPDADGDVHLSMDVSCIPSSTGGDAIQIAML